MLKITGNRHLSQAGIILRGTIISAGTAVVACAIIAYLIINEKVPAVWTQQLILSTLLVSSFLGAKYSNLSAQKSKIPLTFLTGATFILLLMMINVMIPDEKHGKILHQIAVTIIGTAFAAINERARGRGRSPKKYRRNR